MRYKCKCNLEVFCNPSIAKDCETKCQLVCKPPTIVGYIPFAEYALGPLKTSYPPSVQKIYDDIPLDQPEDYNYLVATTNPINYTGQQQGLVSHSDTQGEVWR